MGAFHKDKDLFTNIANSVMEQEQEPSTSAKLARSLLNKDRAPLSLPPILAEFALNQTVNLANSEALTAQLQDRASSLATAVGIQKERMDELELLLDEEMRGKASLEDILGDAKERSRLTLEELNAIKRSRGYQALLLLWTIIWRMRDPRQNLLELKQFGQASVISTRTLISRVISYLSTTAIRILPLRLRYLRSVARGDNHSLDVDEWPQVTLYTDDAERFPGYALRSSIGHTRSNRRMKVTLVATVKNEAGNAGEWLENLGQQTRIPDEVILLEGGSTDNTLGILREFAENTSLDLKLFSRPGTNIATRRNLGVGFARHFVIAMSDFGCTLKPDWLEKIVLPFEINPETEVVAGFYQAVARTRLGLSARQELVPNLADVSPQHFLPACRSIAFKKSAWESVGGFPEWLTQTGEDTYFDLQLKIKSKNWAFVPDAQVQWHSPTTLGAIWRKLFNWAAGDGESGAFAKRYWSSAVNFYRRSFLFLLGLGIGFVASWFNYRLGIVLLLVWIVFILASLSIEKGQWKGLIWGWWRFFGEFARAQGFMHGTRNRPKVIARKYANGRGVVLFLSGVPIDDTGGGSRGAQIAHELIRRGNIVVYVHKFHKHESIDLHLDFNRPHLLHFALEEFDWTAIRYEIAELLRDKPLTAIVEFPLFEYLKIARSVKDIGGSIVYDLIDEWNSSLGGDWYSREIEEAIVEISDILVASEATLAERLERASGREALYLPNAVNTELFDRTHNYVYPSDLHKGSPTIIYVGSLWGNWFDWDLLHSIVKFNPEATVTIIGDYQGQCPFEAQNLHFLGLKSQASLPGYLKHSDVAIIPWKIDKITQATSPLKVFEFIAMGLPVVASNLKPLEGIPYVFLSKDTVEFLRNIHKAQECILEEDTLKEFIGQNSWEVRIERLAEVSTAI